MEPRGRDPRPSCGDWRWSHDAWQIHRAANAKVGAGRRSLDARTSGWLRVEFDGAAVSTPGSVDAATANDDCGTYADIGGWNEQPGHTAASQYAYVGVDYLPGAGLSDRLSTGLGGHYLSHDRCADVNDLRPSGQRHPRQLPELPERMGATENRPPKSRDGRPVQLESGWIDGGTNAFPRARHIHRCHANPRQPSRHLQLDPPCARAAIARWPARFANPSTKHILSDMASCLPCNALSCRDDAHMRNLSNCGCVIERLTRSS